MPLRRGRAYSLMLLRSGQAPQVVTSMETFEHMEVPSQLLYRAAPGGKRIAFRNFQTGNLVVRDVAGGAATVIERGDQFRFSPDGRYLAATVNPNKQKAPGEV